MASVHIPSNDDCQEDEPVEPVAAIDAACERYQAMQEHHLQCLIAAEPCDVEQLVFEREQQFADLHNQLTALVYHLRSAADCACLAASVQQRLQALRQRDALLTQRLADYRTLLEHRREQLQDGQRLVSGYGAFPSHLPAHLVDTCR